MKIIKTIPLFLIIALLSAAPLFSQDAEAYYDELFNQYIELETVLLQKNDDGSLKSYNLGEINDLRLKAIEENRSDVISRLDMLRFIVKTSLDQQIQKQDADRVLAEIAAAEKKYRAEQTSKKAIATFRGISIGTAIASGTIFAASALISSEFYAKYIATELADQAAFYLFWWQNLERAALVSAITTLVSGTAAGILAAVY